MRPFYSRTAGREQGRDVANERHYKRTGMRLAEIPSVADYKEYSHGTRIQRTPRVFRNIYARRVSRFFHRPAGEAPPGVLHRTFCRRGPAPVRRGETMGACQKHRTFEDAGQKARRARQLAGKIL